MTRVGIFMMSRCTAVRTMTCGASCAGLPLNIGVRSSSMQPDPYLPAATGVTGSSPASCRWMAYAIPKPSMCTQDSMGNPSHIVADRRDDAVDLSDSICFPPPYRVARQSSLRRPPNHAAPHHEGPTAQRRVICYHFIPRSSLLCRACRHHRSDRRHSGRGARLPFGCRGESAPAVFRPKLHTAPAASRSAACFRCPSVCEWRRRPDWQGSGDWTDRKSIRMKSATGRWRV
jgi:hypothetical protein